MVMWKWSSCGFINPKKILSQNAAGTFQQRRGCTHLMGRSKSLTEDKQDLALDTNTACGHLNLSLQPTSLNLTSAN